MDISLAKFLEVTNQMRVTGHQETRPSVYCKNGNSVSIQAGKFLYSQPREDCANNYYQVELGFPQNSAKEAITLIEFMEDYADGDSGVYGYTPTEKVIELLDSWGGIDLSKTVSMNSQSDGLNRLSNIIKVKNYINKL